MPPTPPPRILIVDDDKMILSMLADALAPHYVCRTVDSGERALELLAADESFSLVLTDLEMRDGMSGLGLIEQTRLRHPRIPLVLMSASLDARTAQSALQLGAAGLLDKPFDLDRLADVVGRAVATPCSECVWRGVADALAVMLSRKHLETHDHTVRVAAFSLRLGTELGLAQGALFELEMGARLHDIGKLDIPRAILCKPGPLDEGEWKIMRGHPQLGERLLRDLAFPVGVSRVAGQHHERWDGGGYPDGLRAEVIDLNARIFAVADTFDAITSDRVYRPGRGYDDALAEIRAHTGSQFDPTVVGAFLRVPRDEWAHLRKVPHRELGAAARDRLCA
jgi:response regulator RpfG family c-di-GMP phosphodiesterase